MPKKFFKIFKNSRGDLKKICRFRKSGGNCIEKRERVFRSFLPADPTNRAQKYLRKKER